MFSRKTIIEMVNALNLKTHEEIERFALEFVLEDKVSGEYVKAKCTSISKYIILNSDSLGPNGANICIEIIEHIIAQYSDMEPFEVVYSELINLLDKDGYDLTSISIVKKLPSEIPVVEQENELIRILDELNFPVSKGHYEQAISCHARGEWAAANSQLRSFVEDFFNMAQTIVIPGEYSSSHAKKEALAHAGFFNNTYNEFCFNGQGFVEGFWKRLHPEGSHPGLSEQDDSTFRLHLVILVMNHYIRRLYNWEH